jgi:(1->4)-alpha-D-glucan 1-alpha-D-glucosylmutase
MPPMHEARFRQTSPTAGPAETDGRALLRVPSATYRLQLGPYLTFAAATELIGYLDTLGVSDVYASPILQARRGSAHGYDVTDPTRVSAALGGEEAFRAFASTLRSRGMGLLLDIVPNHMAASPENPWWADLLQHGQSSPFAAFFDLAWNPAYSPLGGHLLLAVLGRPYGQVLEGQELALSFGEDGFLLHYYERAFPLDPLSWRTLIAPAVNRLRTQLGETDEVVRALVAVDDVLAGMPSRAATDPRSAGDRRRRTDTARRELWRLARESEPVAAAIRETLRALRGRRGDAVSFDALDRLLRQQVFRLAFWKTAREKLNYRRFFNINELAGLRTEDPRVFEESHRLLGHLVREGFVTGLRVDHVDGLYDPQAYLERLTELAPTPVYVVVEKILTGEEELAEEWRAEGTTGYDFARVVNGVFVDPEGLEVLAATYAAAVPGAPPFGDLAYHARRHIAQELFSGEMRALEVHLARLAEQDRHACDLPVRELVRALGEVTACLPVYRTYVRGFTVRGEDRRVLSAALTEARRRAPTLAARALGFLRRLLLLDLPATLTPAQREDWLTFVMAWQQVTGPIAAKGIEDTALYRQHRLVALNDVGADPAHAAVAPQGFHAFCRRRRERWPAALNTTSTHDSKRSEDVRARLDVLSELAGEWGDRLDAWRRLAAPLKSAVGGRTVPEANTEVLLYQTFLGAWPLEEDASEVFVERITSFAVKAAREAREHTNWLNPDEPYEHALQAFVRGLLGAAGEAFRADFQPFAARVAAAGAVNALAQTLIKLTAPGVPDIYQGCELWDFSLVDPDNRRPVDFARRRTMLEDVATRVTPESVAELVPAWRDGRIKLLLTQRGLGVRRRQRELFLHGEYLPLEAYGAHRRRILAFARRAGNAWAVTVAPRLVARLAPQGSWPLGDVWEDTRLVLPDGAPRSWTNVLTGERLGAPVRLADALHVLPVALLTSA